MANFKHIIQVHSNEDNIKEWIDSIPNESTFYDLGANLGWFSLYAAELGLDTYAVEADKYNYIGLTENISENPHIQNIKTFNYAIADEDKKYQFRIKNQKIGSHNKTLDIEEFAADKRIIVNKIRYEVDGISLDSLIEKYNLPKPTHIKVDIDGSEYLFLKGVQDSLIECEEIMIELYKGGKYYSKSLEILKNLGFVLNKIYHIPNEKNTFNFLYKKTMWKDRKHIFDKHHAQVPIIDMMEDKWRIYYSTRFNGKSKPMWVDVEVNNPTKILNQSTGPILDLGKTGSFDVAGVMPTELIEVGGVKYMYYIGWTNRQDTPYHNTIGLAISKDNGDTWEKFSDGPVFGTSRLEPGFVGTIAVINRNDNFYGYYLSCRDWKEFDGKLEPLYDIKIAMSKDGIDWLPTNRVAIPLKDDEGGISKASIIEHNGMYYMWYSVRKDHDYRTNSDASYRIKCVSSTNLLDWEDVDDFGLDIDLDSDWDNEMVAYPHVFKYNGELQMLYNGNTFGKTGIGHVRFKN